MAKYSVSRLLETSKLLATEAGKQLSELVTYTSDMAENVARLLRNGLTFADNFNCEIREVSARHDIATVIGAKLPVVGIIPIRVVSLTVGLDAFAWFYDDQGRLTIKASFTGAPSAAQKIILVLLF